MDINLLYFQHQISLMRASTARKGKALAAHLAEADGFAHRIRRFKLSKGAGAASMWAENWLPRHPPFENQKTSLGALAS